MVSIDEFFDIPSDCKIDRVISKEKFYYNANLNSKDKKIFKNYIQQIKWYSRLAEDNTNIPPYKDETKRYNEVEIITIVLKDENIKELSNTNKVNNAYFVQDKQIDRIADIVFRFITFPQLIVTQYKNKIKLSVTHLTINLADSSKFTLDEIISTNWIDMDYLNDLEQSLFDNIQLEKLSHENFYLFYSDIVDNIIKYNGSILAGTNLTLPADEIKEINDRIVVLNKEIKVLRRELKKETQPHLISNINNEIRNRRIELRDLTQKLE